MPKGDKLTRKQENFYSAYLKCRNPMIAYRQAYDAKGMSDAACAVEGNKLLKHPIIAQRLARATEKAVERAALTVESVIAELEEARQMAIQKENPSAMAQASMGKAKVGGLIVERAEVKNVDEFERMSTDELREYVSQEPDVIDAGSGTRH